MLTSGLIAYLNNNLIGLINKLIETEVKEIKKLDIRIIKSY